MTVLEAIAERSARIQYDSARRRHERAALDHKAAGRPLLAGIEAKAISRLRRYAPSETVVVARIEDLEHENREGQWK